MPHDSVRVVFICEDNEHDSLVRQLAKKLGLLPLRIEKLGSSTQVLNQVSREVKELRRRKYQRNLALVIVIDADATGVSGRHAELEKRIENEANGARGDDERIAFMVPARNVETWYVHFCVPGARPVDEATDYSTGSEWRQLSRDLGGAARQVAQAWFQTELSDPSSVSTARKELGRVD